jgi:hypothetical protein
MLNTLTLFQNGVQVKNPVRVKDPPLRGGPGFCIVLKALSCYPALSVQVHGEPKGAKELFKWEKRKKLD